MKKGITNTTKKGATAVLQNIEDELKKAGVLARRGNYSYIRKHPTKSLWCVLVDEGVAPYWAIIETLGYKIETINGTWFPQSSEI